MHHDKHTTLKITRLRSYRGLVSLALSMSRALELELLQGFIASGRARQCQQCCCLRTVYESSIARNSGFSWCGGQSVQASESLLYCFQWGQVEAGRNFRIEVKQI